MAAFFCCNPLPDSLYQYKQLEKVVGLESKRTDFSPWPLIDSDSGQRSEIEPVKMKLLHCSRQRLLQIQVQG